MKAVDNLGKVRRGIICGLDHSDKYYRQDCNSGKEQDKSYQYAEYRVERFGDFHATPSLLSLASKRIADSTLPPSWAALLSTCIFSVSSVV